MPRIYRTAKQRERVIIRDFVQYLGYRISTPRWQESPDTILTLSKAKRKTRVAIEHTGFYNDTTFGQLSPLTPICEFWRLVHASLIRRITHRKHLTGIQGKVYFKRNPAIPVGKRIVKQPVAKLLAKEITAFVESHSDIPKSTTTFHTFHNSEFSGSPTMTCLLSSLRIRRFTDKPFVASRWNWLCRNVSTGHVGVTLDYIKTAIVGKNQKAINYNWGNANQRWLLIASVGESVNASAGPQEQNVDWNDPDLKAMCLASPFDRIVFWVRVHSWHKWLKV